MSGPLIGTLLDGVMYAETARIRRRLCAERGSFSSNSLRFAHSLARSNLASSARCFVDTLGVIGRSVKMATKRVDGKRETAHPEHQVRLCLGMLD